MSMSTDVQGLKPPDKTWREMKKIYDSCKELDMDIPDKVDEYFEGRSPDPAGVLVDIPTKEYSDNANSEQGIEIKVEDIPPDVKIIRFCNSWYNKKSSEVRVTSD